MCRWTGHSRAGGAPGIPGNPREFPIPVLPADCREEQYPCTRLYSVHKPCKQCLNEICFYRCVRSGERSLIP